MTMASALTTTTTKPTTTLKFVDIGANLLEERFLRGVYRGSFRHEPDMDLVLQRAQQIGVERIIITAGTLQESQQAVVTCRQWNQQYPGIRFACTVGVHPTRCRQEFAEHQNDQQVLQQLLKVAQDGCRDGTVVAIGEIGLDYDRLEFCPKDIQQKYFIQQLQGLCKPLALPLFLHNRNVGKDLYHILKEHADCWQPQGGVVHSFDDSLDLAQLLIQDLGLYIGINGCSLRTHENLAVAAQLPLDRILLETDAPYCEIRSTHAGYQHIQTQFPAKAEKKFERGLCVKSRQEPCHIRQVAEVLAGAKELPLDHVADACYQNTIRLYSHWK